MVETYFYDLEEIKNRMKELNLSTRKLSFRVGISNQAMQSIIRGNTDLEKVQLKTYKAIVRTLWK